MIPEQHYCAVVVAGGKGVRAGGDVPKQFQVLDDKPVVMHTLEAFYSFNTNIRLILVLPHDFIEYWRQLCQTYQFVLPHTVVEGGDTRFQSVKNGLAKVGDDEVVAIHDAARPFVSPQLIAQCFEMALHHQCGVVPTIDETNSVRLVTSVGSRVLDRSAIRVVQTPQVFPAHLLQEAYETPFETSFTDDASVAEHHGIDIHLVEGEVTNIKITTPLDWVLAEHLIKLSKRQL